MPVYRTILSRYVHRLLGGASGGIKWRQGNDGSTRPAATILDQTPGRGHPAMLLTHGPGSLAGGPRFRYPAHLFNCCRAIVSLVSIHDAALVVFNQHTINEMERNPVGSWLLQMHGGEVWIFVFAKLAGTALVCAILVTAYQNGKWHAIPIVSALATFQLLLLCYLTFA